MGRVLSDFEAEEDDVLVPCTTLFRELRGVSRDGSASQVKCSFNEPEQSRLREGLYSVEL